MTEEREQLAKQAFLLHDQLDDMRRNAQHIVDLPGIRAFIHQFNEKMDEVRGVVAADEVIHKTLAFLDPIDDSIAGSEYPSAIIDGKRGQFMVASGVLMNALKNFMRLYLSEADRERFGVSKLFDE